MDSFKGKILYSLRKEFKKISKEAFDDFYKRSEILKTNGGGYVDIKNKIYFLMIQLPYSLSL